MGMSMDKWYGLVIWHSYDLSMAHFVWRFDNLFTKIGDFSVQTVTLWLFNIAMV